ncbi:hypothetical protein RYX36_035244 [Vicia faba]
MMKEPPWQVPEPASQLRDGRTQLPTYVYTHELQPFIYHSHNNCTVIENNWKKFCNLYAHYVENQLLTRNFTCICPIIEIIRRGNISVHRRFFKKKVIRYKGRNRESRYYSKKIRK